MKVYIQYLDKNCHIETHGNWSDVKARTEHSLKHQRLTFIPLGFKTKFSKYYRAELKPRSSTYKNFKFIQTNSPGEIEGNYSGEWMMSALPLMITNTQSIVEKYNRIGQIQFSIKPDAPWYMKIYDIFCGKPKFIEVTRIADDREGFGSTGV